jgi:hypothetical protein
MHHMSPVTVISRRMRLKAMKTCALVAPDAIFFKVKTLRSLSGRE